MTSLLIFFSLKKELILLRNLKMFVVPEINCSGVVRIRPLPLKVILLKSCCHKILNVIYERSLDEGIDLYSDG